MLAFVVNSNYTLNNFIVSIPNMIILITQVSTGSKKCCLTIVNSVAKIIMLL